MKHRRTPVVGDATYGSIDWNTKLQRTYGVSRPLLHAYETTFIHPFTQEKIVLCAPVPSDMQRVMQSVSTGLPAPLVDTATGYLTCPIEVRGKSAGEKPGGFVPLDRLAFKEVCLLSTIFLLLTCLLDRCTA